MSSDLEGAFELLLFFSLFEVIGGAALGAGLRSLLRRNFAGVFFLIWGAGFGGIPLLIGAASFLSSGQPIYFYAQVFIFLTPAVTVMLLPDDFMQASRTNNTSEAGAIVGAIMAMVGGAVVLLNLDGGNIIALLIGGFFAFLGAFFLIRTAVTILRAL
jgi:hypothetical protein